MKAIDNVSKYTVTWAEFRPMKGTVTKKDWRIISGSRVGSGRRSYLHFADRSAAVRFLAEGLPRFAKLSKSYEVRLFSDAQFGRAESLEKIKFTRKQEAETLTIGL